MGAVQALIKRLWLVLTAPVNIDEAFLLLDACFLTTTFLPSMKKYFLLLFLINSCSVKDLNSPGAIVPPTADEDPHLPQIKITVAGHQRSIHLQQFGNPNNPPLFVLHGGPGADFRLLLPLKALADRFFVVMWDARGAGLSERVSSQELSIDSFDEEVAQVTKMVVPGKKVFLIGHSFGANVLARYTSKHPAEVAQLILIEPGKLDLALRGKSNGGAVSFFDGQDFFWENELLTSSDNASADYKAIDLLPKTARNWTCDGSVVTNYPFWRFGTYHYFIVQKNVQKLGQAFNWAEGIQNFSGRISVVAGSCGALGEAFQRTVNLPALAGSNLHTITGAGHLSLFTDYAKATVDTIRTLLR
jgi:proline iminopeptidase